MLKNHKYINEFSEIRDDPEKWEEQLENNRHLFVMAMDVKAIEWTCSDISCILQGKGG